MKKIHTGTPMQVEYAAPRIRMGLLLACGALDPTPRVKPKPQRQRGAPPRKAEDPITDEVLAQLRGDHDLRGMSLSAVASKYGIDCDRARRLCGYINRCHVKAV